MTPDSRLIRYGLVFALLVAAATLVLTVPGGIQELRWIFDPERFITETGPPRLIDYQIFEDDPIPRGEWSAGDIVYIERQRCVWREVPGGSVPREIVGVAPVSLADGGIHNELDPGPGAYEAATGGGGQAVWRLKPPPWCGRHVTSVALPGFLSPGKMVLRVRVDAWLNPRKPHVVTALTPVPIVIVTSPTRQAIAGMERALSAHGRLMSERINDTIRRLDRIDSTFRILDHALRARGVLPPGLLVPEAPPEAEAGQKKGRAP